MELSPESLAPGSVNRLLPVPVERVSSTLPVRSITDVEVELDAEESKARSGINLLDVLRVGADELIERSRPEKVATNQQLERARSALVRGMGAEILNELDMAWSGASESEEGWYLRASAFLLLGLPEEADKVLSQAQSFASSKALLFLASLAKFAIGLKPSARELLERALLQEPDNQVLLGWKAAIEARSGNSAEAKAFLIQLGEMSASPILLQWLKNTIANAQVNEAKLALFLEKEEVFLPQTEIVLPGVIVSKLHDVGRLLRYSDGVEVADGVEILLRQLTVGGALDGVCRPNQILALRNTLSALLAQLGSSSYTLTESEIAVNSLSREFFSALILGRSSDIRTLLEVAPQRGGNYVASILASIYLGYEDLGEYRESLPTAKKVLGSSSGAMADPYILPVRLGLSLLEEKPAVGSEVAAALSVAAQTVPLRSVTDSDRKRWQPHSARMERERFDVSGRAAIGAIWVLVAVLAYLIF